MKRPVLSTALKAALGAAAVAGVAWGGWVYTQAQPQQLVNRSAFRNFHAAVAEKTPDKAPAPKHAKKTGGYVPWKALSADQQALLKPLEKRWDYLSINQRRSLLAAAKRYATMTGQQKIDFGARLVQWAQLTGKQRREIREHYKQFASLAPGQREQVKEEWLAEHEDDTGNVPASFSNP
jgi:hypothetical protein